MAIQEATSIALTVAERATLAGWVRSGKTEHRLVARAQIVLLAGAGWGSRAIAREVGCARGVVSRWRVRFAKARLAGLADAPRSGKPKTYGADAGRRILALLDRPPPAGFARWTAPLLAKELGDISDQHVWRFLRAQRVDLAGRKSWCLSSDPEFAAKVRDRAFFANKQVAMVVQGEAGLPLGGRVTVVQSADATLEQFRVDPRSVAP